VYKALQNTVFVPYTLSNILPTVRNITASKDSLTRLSEPLKGAGTTLGSVFVVFHWAMVALQYLHAELGIRCADHRLLFFEECEIVKFRFVDIERIKHRVL
jgi:hypothetical protein